MTTNEIRKSGLGKACGVGLIRGKKEPRQFTGNNASGQLHGASILTNAERKGICAPVRTRSWLGCTRIHWRLSKKTTFSSPESSPSTLHFPLSLVLSQPYRRRQVRPPQPPHPVPTPSFLFVLFRGRKIAADGFVSASMLASFASPAAVTRTRVLTELVAVHTEKDRKQWRSQTVLSNLTVLYLVGLVNNNSREPVKQKNKKRAGGKASFSVPSFLFFVCHVPERPAAIRKGKDKGKQCRRLHRTL